MGEIVHTTCTQCDVDRIDTLGWGMDGSNRTLCGCDNCQRLVLKNGRWDDDETSERVFRCPYCKRKLTRIFPPSDAAGAAARTLQRCPRCTGKLRCDSEGMWD